MHDTRREENSCIVTGMCEWRQVVIPKGQNHTQKKSKGPELDLRKVHLKTGGLRDNYLHVVCICKIMKVIWLFDIKMRTLGYAFCQPPIKSIPKSFYPRKVTTKFLSQKSPGIPDFNPKKGLRRPLSLLYLSIPWGMMSQKNVSVGQVQIQGVDWVASQPPLWGHLSLK